MKTDYSFKPNYNTGYCRMIASNGMIVILTHRRNIGLLIG